MAGIAPLAGVRGRVRHDVADLRRAARYSQSLPLYLVACAMTATICSLNGYSEIRPTVKGKSIGTSFGKSPLI